MKKLLIRSVIVFAILAVVGIAAYYRMNSGESESTPDTLNGAELAALRRALGKLRDESVAAQKPVPESITVGELHARKLFSKPELSGFPGCVVELNTTSILAVENRTDWLIRVRMKDGSVRVLMGDGSVQEPAK
jgi:hypothetical protein